MSDIRVRKEEIKNIYREHKCKCDNEDDENGCQNKCDEDCEWHEKDEET